MSYKAVCSALLLSLSSVSILAQELPTYKVHIDPIMAIAGYANVQVDKSISSTVSVGAMLWHLNDASWGSFADEEETSAGIRIDWFETGVYQKGWHSNAMIKGDWLDSDYARTRIKLTQTYQLVRGDLFVNLGIGAQFVVESDAVKDSIYSEYQSWMLPSWEFSVSRAF
jgi:hypothetical protein